MPTLIIAILSKTCGWPSQQVHEALILFTLILFSGPVAGLPQKFQRNFIFITPTFVDAPVVGLLKIFLFLKLLQLHASCHHLTNTCFMYSIYTWLHPPHSLCKLWLDRRVLRSTGTQTNTEEAMRWVKIELTTLGLWDLRATSCAITAWSGCQEWTYMCMHCWTRQWMLVPKIGVLAASLA